MKIQQAVLLSEDAVIELLTVLLSIARLTLVLVAFYFYVVVVLSFFGATRELSWQIIDKVIEPLTKVVWPAIVSYAPSLFFLAIIIVGAHYTIAFTHFLFREIELGTIQFPGFQRDWADATYKIVRFLIIAFALVLAVPYLPGSGSPAFQQVGLFLGVLLSLGSTGAISHIVAGVFLTYTGAFRSGDRVKIADTVGDVVEKTLLATRIRTIKNELITIPNGLVLGSHIVNYSSSALNPGLILHTSVTIGYNVPWQTVEHLLIEAARATENILEVPPPFVFQTSLNDFHISYEINAYTNKPEIMANTYAELHRNIQNKFNEAGVEIMSPGYSALRDGNSTTVPSDYLPPTYEPPPFRVAGIASPAAQRQGDGSSD
ncbi:MAG TPA: mechanosensitive ion channel family protein [Candidatus Obscuribacterales bacterium]